MVKFVDFKSANTENALYGPALIQKLQEKAPAAGPSQDDLLSNTAASSEFLSQASGNADRSKNHFIRKKQSHCNIKRECGVSYVKKTESKQEDVRNRGYEKLPPIVI